MQKVTRLLIAAFFGSIILVTRLFVPPPIDRMLIVVDAVLLALSGLFIKHVGATYVGIIGGGLVALARPSLLPFSFIFVAAFGILVDLSFFVFKITTTSEGVNRNRLMIAMAFSTLIIGFISYYSIVLFPQLIPSFPLLDAMVAFMGPVTGATAGYAAAYLWNRYLRNVHL